jgi:Na+/melibiose symporter-like transporter
VPLRNVQFRRLLLIYVFNGTAAAIPATLVLFFVEDVIGRGDLTAHFLVTYFAAGACGMPLWPWLAARYGKAQSWRWAMLAAIGVFAWAATLQAGAVLPFFVICALSGLALGADLALPPALLADLIERAAADGEGLRSGGYFGLWTLVTKLNLALAAGIALPLVTYLGYVPGVAQSATGISALALCYAALPCGLKLIALLLLWRSPQLALADAATGARVTALVGGPI